MVGPTTPSPRHLRIGTRGSKLALVQANHVRNLLLEAHGEKELEVGIEVISTAGDRIQNRPLSEVGGKGLFTLEIEQRLSERTLDLAVHSAKDMPTKLPEGLGLVCFPEREDVSDAFLSPKAQTLAELPEGAIVGSASLRRGALVRRLRPDCQIVLFRGNVDTRLKKLQDGAVDATLLATAGLTRLGLDDEITSRLPVEEFPPAPGQGAICIEIRTDNSDIRKLLEPLNHRDTETALQAEREFLAGLDGSCRTPIAAYARLDGETIKFHGMILTPDGSQCHETKSTGTIGDAREIGATAADKLRKEAGPRFFESW